MNVLNKDEKDIFWLHSSSTVEIVPAGSLSDRNSFWTCGSFSFHMCNYAWGLPQKCLRNSLHMSTPDVRFLLTMFLPQVQDQKKRCRSPDGGMMHWWPLESQHVIAIMNQHHRHHLPQICKTEVSTSFRTVSHKGTFPFFMMFDGSLLLLTHDMKHAASMSSSRIFRTSWHIHATLLHNIGI